MKKIIRYNAFGLKEFDRMTLKRLSRYIPFTFATLISQILRFCLQRGQKPKRYKISIAAIFKNEGEYLKEWICYHRLIGVEHFYLYNNFSTDDYLEVLSPYIEEGCVTLIDWDVPHGQLSAYQHCIESHSAESNWIAFIDIDEFICLKRERNLGDWLKRYRRYPSVLINWKMFGTSGIIERDRSKLIIEQFDSSWAECVDVGKSIINTSYKFKPCNHCHRFKASLLGFGVPPVDEFKQFIVNWLYMPNVWRRDSTIQVNHYWSKSYNDFIYKDSVRGSAMSSKATMARRENLHHRFECHESMNVTKDHTIQRFLIELRNCIN